MDLPLEEFLQIPGITRHTVAAEIKKDERSIRNWIRDGGHTVIYDGRSLKIIEVWAPKRCVYSCPADTWQKERVKS